MGCLEKKPVEKMNEEIVDKFLDVYMVRYFMMNLYLLQAVSKNMCQPSIVEEIPHVKIRIFIHLNLGPILLCFVVTVVYFFDLFKNFARRFADIWNKPKKIRTF